MRLLKSYKYMTSYNVVAGSAATRPFGAIDPNVGGGNHASFYSLVLRATASTISVGTVTLRMRVCYNLEDATYITMVAQNMQSASAGSSAAAVALAIGASAGEMWSIHVGPWTAYYMGIPAESYDFTLQGATTGDQAWSAWVMLWDYNG